MASPNPTVIPSPLVPSSSPIPLSPTQEAQVRELYYKRVRSICSDEIRLFAECVAGRTFSVTWKCRNAKHAMNACVNGNSTRQQQDAARTEWFAGRDDRLRERETKQKEKEESKQKHHEWWGLDEQGRRLRYDESPAALNSSPEKGKLIKP